MIIVVNKWDLVTGGELKAGRPSKAMRMRESKRPGDRDAYEERLRYDLKFLNYAPIVFISAQTGKGSRRSFRCSKRSPPSGASAFPPLR